MTSSAVRETLSRERRLAGALLGGRAPTILDTDAYKLSMAQAGFPGRPETFCLSFRQGPGAWLNPFDLEAVVAALRPGRLDDGERRWLEGWGYGLGPDMEPALRAPVEHWSVPKGCWFGAGEPILVVRSASLLASWMEPLVLMLHYPIQVATAAARGQRRFVVTCEDEAEIVRLAFEAAGVGAEPDLELRESEYRSGVRAAASAIVTALGGRAPRAFEVGMRAATCLAQHRVALEECGEVGIGRTSNLRLARELGLAPVGTTGHEHQLRWGDDAEGFRAIRDRRPGRLPSYLFDTLDPIRIGIPAIRAVVEERPADPFAIRFDSGSHRAQVEQLEATLGRRMALATLIFEDGYDAAKTSAHERWLAARGLPQQRVLYGYGGALVSAPASSDLTRDHVSAAWKLSESGGVPRMKFSGSPGKASIPGRPCTFVSTAAQGEVDRLVGQEGEEPPEGFVRLRDAPERARQDRPLRVRQSAATGRLVAAAERDLETRAARARSDPSELERRQTP